MTFLSPMTNPPPSPPAQLFHAGINSPEVSTSHLSPRIHLHLPQKRLKQNISRGCDLIRSQALVSKCFHSKTTRLQVTAITVKSIVAAALRPHTKVWNFLYLNKCQKPLNHTRQMQLTYTFNGCLDMYYSKVIRSRILTAAALSCNIFSLNYFSLLANAAFLLFLPLFPL